MNNKQLELTLCEIHKLNFCNMDIEYIKQTLYAMHLYKYILKKIYI